MRKIHLTMLIANLIVFAACQPQKMIFKPTINPLIINDSIYVKISNGNLLYNGNYHYSTQLYINNKSHFAVCIDKQSGTLVSVYESMIISYEFNYLSDNIIEPQSEKKIYLAFNRNRKDSITSDFFSNQKYLKENHKFVMNLHFIVGDSIVKREIIFMQK